MKQEHVIYRKRKRAPKQSEDQKKRAKSLNFDIISIQIALINQLLSMINKQNSESNCTLLLHCMCARETMRQYVGVASLVEILYLRLSSLSLPHTDTQYTVVVKGCQNKKEIQIFIKK